MGDKDAAVSHLGSDGARKYVSSNIEFPLIFFKLGKFQEFSF